MKSILTGLLLCALSVATPAWAQSVSVKSGEHGAFTRLVLTFPDRVDWVLGRTDDGYALRVANPDLTYDLSSVYQLITKQRLRSIWVDPTGKDLMLGIDCPCHAIPFEWDRRTLVIDIKDGAPPPSSSFERALDDGVAAPPLQSAPQQRPRRIARQDQAYDWLTRPPVETGQDPDQSPLETASALDSDIRLEDFRSMLIEEVGRGATQGVVEMERPSSPPETDGSDDPDGGNALPDNARAALNELPGIEISSDSNTSPDLMVEGGICPEPDSLDLGAWAATDEAATELTLARAAMLAEFDVPDPAMVRQAAKTHLHFGFGAEARLLLSSFLTGDPSVAGLLGLSYLVDGEMPPENPFRDMQSCASGAALWALLAVPGTEPLPFVNGAAVGQAFLSLPTHLRTALGPETAKRLMKSGDTANAEVVRQSFERATSQDDPTVDLLAADQALLSGDPKAAEAALPTDAMGETALSALITLVEARFQQRKAVEGTEILSLESFAFEHGNGPLRPELDRALALGHALGGNFAKAFLQAKETPGLEKDVWLLLAEVGAESQLLPYAVGPDPNLRADLPLATRTRIAERLLDAGLPDAAGDWASAEEGNASLAARIALAKGDARAAVRILSADLSGADPDLLAASYTALGDYRLAANSHDASGNASDAARARNWAGDWSSRTDTEPGTDPWGDVAAIVDPAEDATNAPPLQASAAQLEQSAATRAAIARLLDTAPMVPESP